MKGFRAIVKYMQCGNTLLRISDGSRRSKGWLYTYDDFEMRKQLQP